jgi:hypothetical protein
MNISTRCKTVETKRNEKSGLRAALTGSF